VFTEEALRAVYPAAQQGERIAELLAGLLDSNLIYRDGAERTASYAFTHVIVQEAIYELLPLVQRKRLHHRIADWLEARHGGAMAGFHGVLANHCAAAEEFSRALDHLEGGAVTAIRHSAYREAISNIHTAQRIAKERSLEPDALRKARWHSLLGDSHHELSEYSQARAHYLETLALLGRPYAPGTLGRLAGISIHLAKQMTARTVDPTGGIGSESLASHAHARLAEIYYHENDPMGVLHLTLLSVDEARHAKAIPELCAGYGALAIAFGQAGFAKVARSYMQRAIALAEARPTEVNDIAYAHLLAMVYASSQCDWAVLDTSGPRAEMLYADLGDGFRRASAQVLGLVGDIQRGRYARATTTLEKMAPYVATDAPPRVAGWYFDNTLQRDIALGRVMRADVEARTHTAEQVESLVDTLTSCGNTASAWLRLGDTANALACAERGLQLLLGNAPVAGAGYIYGPLGVVEALLACWDRVDAAQAARACKMLETYTQRVPSTRPRGYFLLAYYEELKGSLRKSIKLWRKAAASAAQMSMPYDRAAALLALGQRLPPGNAELEQALTIFKSLDVPIPDLFQPTKTL
jgi:adenylate cyclase